MNLEGFEATDIDLSGPLSTSDEWILHRLNETARDVTRLMDQYDFGEVGRLLYNFIWDDFCDWYIEFSKLSLYGDDEAAKATTKSVLAYVLDHTLRLLHPFMPFLTEEIWQHLPHEGQTITLAPWPQYDASRVAEQAVKEMNLLMNIIRAVRNIRAEVNVPMSKKVEMIVKPADEDTLQILQRNTIFIERFCGTSKLEMSLAAVNAEQTMTAVVSGAQLYLPLAGLIDISQEIERLQKELKVLDAEVERVEKKLANENFVKKAPEKVVEEEKAKQKDYQDKRDKVQLRLQELQNMV